MNVIVTEDIADREEVDRALGNTSGDEGGLGSEGL